MGSSKLSRRLFRWFAPKRAEKIFEILENHLELTKNSVSDLYKMVEAAYKGEIPQSKELYASISKMESKADELRRELVEKLTTSELFPEERDDLMELVRAVDWVADWSKEAGRILAIIPFEKAPEEMKEVALNMCREDVNCVAILIESVRTVLEDPKKAISQADKVEMLEENVDELYSVARMKLATLEYPDFNDGSLILLNEFLDALETVADWCENTADIVRAVALHANLG
jgi:predicted phosphate transport protein (TIGR00153 family)